MTRNKGHQMVEVQIIATFYDNGQGQISYGGRRKPTRNELQILSDWLDQTLWPEVEGEPVKQ